MEEVDIYDVEFKVTAPGASSNVSSSGKKSRPTKVQKVAGDEEKTEERPSELYDDRDCECCIVASVENWVSEARVRDLFAAAGEISFVSFVTDSATGMSLDKVYVCFTTREAASEARKLAESSKTVPAREFEELMAAKNLRPLPSSSSSSSSSSVPPSSSSSSKRRSRSREKRSRSREKDRKRDSSRDRRDKDRRDRNRDSDRHSSRSRSDRKR